MTERVNFCHRPHQDVQHQHHCHQDVHQHHSHHDVRLHHSHQDFDERKWFKPVVLVSIRDVHCVSSCCHLGHFHAIHGDGDGDGDGDAPVQ